MAARLNTIVAIAMLALYDEFDTYWQNGGYKKISDIIFAETCHIFIVSNLCPSPGQRGCRGVLFFMIKQNCEQQLQFKYSSQARLCSSEASCWVGGTHDRHNSAPELAEHPPPPPLPDHAGSIPAGQR